MINVMEYLVLQRSKCATHSCPRPHLSLSLSDEDSIVLRLMYRSAGFRGKKVGSRGVVDTGRKGLIEELGKNIRSKITHTCIGRRNNTWNKLGYQSICVPFWFSD